MSISFSLIVLLIFILICHRFNSNIAVWKSFKFYKTKNWFSSVNSLNALDACGFWSGLFIWFVAPLADLFMFDRFQDKIMNGIFLGFLSSGTSYILDKIFSDDGIKIKIEKEK